MPQIKRENIHNPESSAGLTCGDSDDRVVERAGDLGELQPLHARHVQLEGVGGSQVTTSVVSITNSQMTTFTKYT